MICRVNKEILKEIKRIDPKISNYSIAKKLRSIGIDIAPQTLDGYEKKGSNFFRFDVAHGVQLLWFHSKEREFWELIKKASGIDSDKIKKLIKSGDLDVK